VHGDEWYAGGPDASVPASVEVPRLHRCAEARGEDRPAAGPVAAADDKPLAGLCFVVLERGDADIGQGKGEVRRIGLGLATHEPSADALALPGQRQFAGLEVHVLPGQHE
jgi:hypothetical protein